MVSRSGIGSRGRRRGSQVRAWLGSAIAAGGCFLLAPGSWAAGGNDPKAPAPWSCLDGPFCHGIWGLLHSPEVEGG